ncbi:MAG: SEC-C metal-binding domain-containing protein [Acidimicrobiales bacterium]
MSSGLDAELDLRSPKPPEPGPTVIVDDDDPYDNDGWGLSDLDADLIYDAVAELVEAGPTTIEALIEALTSRGEVLSHVDADEAGDLLGPLLADMPGIWTHRSSVARIVHLLEGRAFTHRLTATDLRNGGVESEPDLPLLGCTAGTTTLADGTELASTEDPETGWHGYVGPPRWLDGFQLGDLVALRYTAGRWSLEEVPDPGDGSAETRALLESLAPALQAGAGDELLSPVLDGLSADDTLFRTPVLPASELLTAAGLLRDGPFVGPSDQIWYPHRSTLELRVFRVASLHDVTGCCLAALRRVATRWRAYELGLTALSGVPSTAEAVSALDHDGVATALVDLMVLPRAADRAAAFVDELLAPDPESAGPLALGGALADRLARHEEAEDRYRRALTADPTTVSAVTGLAWLAFDRGQFAAAGRLLHQVLEPGHRHVKLVADIARVFPEPGRNAPCPCGSGRKFKACHREQVIVAPEARPHVLLAKLSRFAATGSFDMARLQMLAAGLPHDDPAMRAIASELHLFDRESATSYLRWRGALLPEEERSLLARIIDTPLRLVEVADGPADGSVTFGDAITGEAIDCRLPLPDASVAPGAVGLARIIDGALVGRFVPVPGRENQLLVGTALTENGRRPEQQGHVARLFAAMAPLT